MTEPLEPHGRTVECHCGVPFTPRKAGHVFHSAFCRHRGEREPHERRPVDQEQLERLFDESRDPGERVRPDEWHPGPAEWLELDACDTLESRRRWYLNLMRRSVPRWTGG
jgi:hypothetical protein